MTLRPIGTEFEYVAPPDRTSSRSVYSIIVYRVVAHNSVVSPYGSGEVESEMVEVASITDYPVTEWHFDDYGQMQPIRPAALLAALGRQESKP